MDLIRATPMTFGTLVWPLRPPALSMLLVVKGTFDVVHRGLAKLAGEQPWPTGVVLHDDDPDRSPRLDNDFALMKPSGECFLAGTCHPPEIPATVSAVAFGVGPIKKGIGVFGDRRWKGGLLGKKPSEPAPFESMELSWERAFGGPGYAPNPYGRGQAPIETDEGKVHPLPNLELMQRPIATPNDRPEPAIGAPMPPHFEARLRYAGTYDEGWIEKRFPYLAVDFDPTFYYAAPPDQRLQKRFWTGDEDITLRHLVKGTPFMQTRLPGLRPRGFVCRHEGAGKRFEEVPLVLDTITVDADAMRVHCVWRGHVEVRSEKLADVERIFLMHEPLRSGRSAEGCRERMEAHLRLRALEQSGFVANRPEEDEDKGTVALEAARASLGDDPAMKELLERAMRTQSLDGLGGATVAEAPAQPEEPEPERAGAPEPPPAPPPAAQLLEDIMAKLAEGGMDVSELIAKAKEEPTKPAGPPDPAEVREAFEKTGNEMPPELEEVLEEVERIHAAPPPEPTADEDEVELEPRQRFLLAYAEGRAVEGDFTGVDLSGEDLSGLVAPRVILAGADLTGCVLRDADLTGAVLARARLDEAVLRDAKLEGVDASRARGRRAQLKGADLTDAILDDADFVAASFDGATLTNLEARRVDLTGAQLEGVDGDGADFSDGTLTGICARGSSLVEARLTAAKVEDADLSECDLTKLRASFGARLDRTNLRRSKLDGARFRDASLVGANFSFASLARANFSGAKMERAILAGCVMVKAKLIGADLRGAQILESDLMTANLMGANLDGCDLRGSSLYAAEVFRARAQNVRLELTDVTGTKWEGRT